MMIPQMVTQRFVRDCAVQYLLYLMVPTIIFFCNELHPLSEATPTPVIKGQHLISQQLANILERTGSMFHFMLRTMHKNFIFVGRIHSDL